MVIFALLTSFSIRALPIAGVIPGVVFALLLCAATLIRVLRHPDEAPKASEHSTLAKKLYALRLTGPCLLLIACNISGLYCHVFTPIQAGGISAAVTLLMALIRQRGFAGLQLSHTLHHTVKSTATIFAIVVGALVFARFVAVSGLPVRLGDFLIRLDVNRWGVALVIVVAYLVFSMMMDAPALLAILLPVAHPVTLQRGFDSVWFAVFVGSWSSSAR